MGNGPCHFNMAGEGPMHMSTDESENKDELHASESSLAYFFKPYNELLTKLSRPDFGWSDRPQGVQRDALPQHGAAAIAAGRRALLICRKVLWGEGDGVCGQRLACYDGL